MPQRRFREATDTPATVMTTLTIPCGTMSSRPPVYVGIRTRTWVGTCTDNSYISLRACERTHVVVRKLAEASQVVKTTIGASCLAALSIPAMIGS